MQNSRPPILPFQCLVEASPEPPASLPGPPSRLDAAAAAELYDETTFWSARFGARLFDHLEIRCFHPARCSGGCVHLSSTAACVGQYGRMTLENGLFGAGSLRAGAIAGEPAD
jgi:hypothetical protein